jgi:hypothetical protein
MLRALFFATAATMVFACSGSNPPVTASGTGDPIGGGTGQLPTGTDGGTTDGGTATDGGTGTCNTQALPPAGAFATETCTTGTPNITTMTFVTAGCNQVQITNGGSLNCFGNLTGAANAFSGTCNSLPCSTATPSGGPGHLPGTIFCTLANTSQCTVQICNDTTGSNCPP